MTDRMAELADAIHRLTESTRQAQQLARGNPAAERNLYMIRQHLEMLKIEICEPLEVIQQGDQTDDG